MCIHFEEVEFKKNQFGYSDGVEHNDSHHDCKNIVPKLVKEREREREKDCTNGHWKCLRKKFQVKSVYIKTVYH